MIIRDVEPYFLSSVRNPIGVRVNADDNWANNEDYYLKLVIEVEEIYKSGNFVILDLDIRATPDKYTVVEFNLSRPLSRVLSSERPGWEDTMPKIGGNACKRYKYSIEEWVDGSLSTSILSDIKHVVKAGFGFIKGQFLQEYANSMKWLTHQPREKLSSRHAGEFLYYLHVGESTTLEMFADLVFEDDSVQNGYQPNISISVGKGDLVIFPVGYQSLGLEQFVTPPIKSYEVYLAGNVSERMKFTIDCTYEPRERFYLFENSLGGYDTVRTTGRLKESQATESQTYQKPVPIFYDSTLPTIVQSQTRHTDIFSQHTGILSLDGVRWLKDLLRSDDSIRIGGPDENHFAKGIYWPIVIGRGENDIREDDNFLYGLAFNYTDAFNNIGI